MNKIYKVVWSKTRNCYVVVSELAKRHTKSPKSGLGKTLTMGAVVGALVFGMAGSTWAATEDELLKYVDFGNPVVGPANAEGNGSIAIGFGTTASEGGIAVGINVTASGLGAVALGAGNATATGTGSLAFGQSTKAIGNYSVAFGQSATAGNISYSLVSDVFRPEAAKAVIFDATYLEAGGTETAVKTDTSGNVVYELDGTPVLNTDGGYKIYVDKDGNPVVSRYVSGRYKNFVVNITKDENGNIKTQVTNTESTAGIKNTNNYVLQENSAQYPVRTGQTAFGQNTFAIGANSTAFGRSTIAAGDESTAFGKGTLASGAQSTAFGTNTVAQGDISTAFGSDTLASGSQSTAFGHNTIARGSMSTAFGVGTTAHGEYATAWGTGTLAHGVGSTAWGQNTKTLFVIPRKDTGEKDRYGNIIWKYEKDKTVRVNRSNSNNYSAAFTDADNNYKHLGNMVYSSEQGKWVFTPSADGQALIDDGTYTEYYVLNGEHATAWGFGSTAGGNYSTAWGHNSSASGHAATAWGLQSYAPSEYATAFGMNSLASGVAATAWGQESKATADEATAWGYRTLANAYQATAWGHETTAAGIYATAAGQKTSALGTHSTALGFDTLAAAVESNTFGDTTTSLNEQDAAWGSNALASGPSATAFGDMTSAIGAQTTAWGKNSVAGGIQNADGKFVGLRRVSQHIYQLGDTITDKYEVFDPLSDTTIQQVEVTYPRGADGSTYYTQLTDILEQEGYTVPNPWNYSSATAFGENTLASGHFATAFGLKTEASGTGATSFGNDTHATNAYATAFGYHTKATEEGATAFGLYTEAKAAHATAFGHGESASNPNLASGEASTAFGSVTKATGWSSTAFGSWTRASGDASTAFGSGTVASGWTATAIGQDSKARGHQSTALGLMSNANGENSLAALGGTTGEGGTWNYDDGSYGGEWVVNPDEVEDPELRQGNSSVAIGQNAVAKPNYTYAIGQTAQALSKNSIAIGNGATVASDWSSGNEVKNENGVAFGSQTGVYADNGAVFGYDSSVGSKNGIAVGHNAYVNANWSTGEKVDTENGIAIGYTVGTFATDAITIGTNSNVYGEKSIAIGSGHEISGAKSGAFGDPTTITADDSYSVGNNNTLENDLETNKKATGVFAVGNNITKIISSSVFLGENAAYVQAADTLESGTTGGLKEVNEATVNGITYSGFAGKTPVGVISVGDSGSERRIQNVAAGLISSTSTDAINGSQLYQALANQAAKFEIKAGDNITVTTTKKDGFTTYTISSSNATAVEAGANVTVDGPVETTDSSEVNDNAAGGAGSQNNDGSGSDAGSQTNGGEDTSVDKGTYKTDTYTVNATDTNTTYAGKQTTESGEGPGEGSTTFTLTGSDGSESSINIKAGDNVTITKDVDAAVIKAENTTYEIKKKAGKKGTNVVNDYTLVGSDGKEYPFQDTDTTYSFETDRKKEGTVAATFTVTNEQTGEKVGEFQDTHNGLIDGSENKVKYENGEGSVTITDQDGNTTTITGIRDNSEAINNLDNKINRMDSKIDKVGAGAAALAGLHPLDFDPDEKWDFAAAVGSYKSEQAVAVGAFYRPNEDTMFSIGGTIGNGNNMVNVGVSWKFGQKNRISANRISSAKEIIELRKNQEDVHSFLADAVAGNQLDLSKIQLFPDVEENHWAYDYVATMAGNGVLEGYPDGYFKGNRNMTRYEMAAVLYRLMQNGARLSDRALTEFAPELDRIRVDTITKHKDGTPHIQRVRTIKERVDEKADLSSEKDTKKKKAKIKVAEKPVE